MGQTCSKMNSKFRFSSIAKFFPIFWKNCISFIVCELVCEIDLSHIFVYNSYCELLYLTLNVCHMVGHVWNVTKWHFHILNNSFRQFIWPSYYRNLNNSFCTDFVTRQFDVSWCAAIVSQITKKLHFKNWTVNSHASSCLVSTNHH